MAFATFAKWGRVGNSVYWVKMVKSGDSRGQKHSKDIQKPSKKIKKTYPKDLISKFFAWTFARHVQASYRFFVHKATLRESEVNHGSSALVSSHGSTNIHHWSKVCFKGAPSTSALPGPALLRLTGAAEAGSNASPWATSFKWYQWHQHTTEKRESTVDSTVNPQQSLRDFIVYSLYNLWHNANLHHASQCFTAISNWSPGQNFESSFPADVEHSTPEHLIGPGLVGKSWNWFLGPKERKIDNTMDQMSSFKPLAQLPLG